MILYFSGTGNCKYVARQIAKALDDCAVSVETQAPQITLHEGEVLGIVTPTHWWEVPAVLRKFLREMTVTGQSSYTFAVATYGALPGFVGEDVRRLLRPHGIGLDGIFGVRMPDTWTPVFDLSDRKKVQAQLDVSETELQKVIAKIRSHTPGNHTFPRTPYFLHPTTDAILHFVRQTKHFRVTDECIGCGQCHRDCPAKAITMQDGKPVWTKESCTLCLRCVHSCPAFAIQYGGGGTRKHGQYKHPKADL